MQTLRRSITDANATLATQVLQKIYVNKFNRAAHFRKFSSKGGGDEWNEAWETAWLPEDLTPKSRAPWETDVNFPSDATESVVVSGEVDEETKAFVEEMNENWEDRKKGKEKDGGGGGNGLYSLESIKKDYRLRKQRVHAGLWVKEIEKQEEAKLGDVGGDDIERLLDSCSEIFDSPNNDLNNTKIPSTSEFKNKPDGWETTSKSQDGNVWEMSQREEDILLQEFDRRIAYCKFQEVECAEFPRGKRTNIASLLISVIYHAVVIASFIKTHIFSRRRPIDGWKYMIEEIGPNARRGKGSVSRLPGLSDPSTQPYKEEKTQVSGTLSNVSRRR